MLKSFKEESKYILKNKVSLFVLFIAPVLVNILMGIVFTSQQIKNIPMAAIDQDNSYLSRMIVQEFDNNEVFDVKYNVNSEKQLKYLFDSGQVKCAIIIPKDFSKDTKGLKNPSVMMVYDGSNMPITSAAKSRASEILLSLKVGLSTKMMEGVLNFSQNESQKSAQSIMFVNRFLYNPTKSFKNFLNTGFGGAIVQTCVVIVAASAIRKRELAEEKIDRIGFLGGKILFYSLSGIIGFIISIFTQTIIFNIPFKGSFAAVSFLIVAMSVAIASVAIAISAWVSDKSIATTINAVIFIPSSVLAGYTWPVASMPLFYQIIAKYLPFYHYGDNIRDLYLKGKTISELLPDLLWFGIYAAIFIIIGFIKIMAINISENNDTNDEFTYDEKIKYNLNGTDTQIG